MGAVLIVIDGPRVVDKSKLGTDLARCFSFAFIHDREDDRARVREMIAEEPGIIILAGETGAHEFPDAPVKIFLTASIELRAGMEYVQSHRDGQGGSFYEIIGRLRSAGAEHLQVEKPKDVIEIDCTTLGDDEVFETALAICRDKLSLR